MKKDTDMIVHRFDSDIIVYPVSDVHFGALEHDRKAWEAFCASVLAIPNVYLILGGDLINNATRSSVSNIFDEVVRPRDQKKIMAEMLEPLRDRILCAVPGNHERRSVKDADDEPIYDIMCKLNLEDLYRPNMAFMKIQIGTQNGGCRKGRAMTSYTVGVTHGAGGGIYTGATVNRNERFGNVIEGLDCLIVGHTHKGTITKPSKLVVDTFNNVVVCKPYLVISSVPWQNYGGYAMQKMLLPAAACDPQKLLFREIERHKPKKIEVIW